jgi:hypothetical protein
MATFSRIKTLYRGTRGATGSQDRPNQATTVELWRDTDGDDAHTAIKALSDSLTNGQHPVWTDLRCVLPIIEAEGGSVYRATMFYDQDDANVPYKRLGPPIATGSPRIDRMWVPKDASNAYSSGYTAEIDANGQPVMILAERAVIVEAAFEETTGSLNISSFFAKMGKTNSNTIMGITTTDSVLYLGPSPDSWLITSGNQYNKIWHQFAIAKWITNELNGVSPWSSFQLESDMTVTVTKPGTTALPDVP